MLRAVQVASWALYALVGWLTAGAGVTLLVFAFSRAANMSDVILFSEDVRQLFGALHTGSVAAIGGAALLVAGALFAARRAPDSRFSGLLDLASLVVGVSAVALSPWLMMPIFINLMVSAIS